MQQEPTILDTGSAAALRSLRAATSAKAGFCIKWERDGVLLGSIVATFRMMVKRGVPPSIAYAETRAATLSGLTEIDDRPEGRENARVLATLLVCSALLIPGLPERVQ